MKKYIIILLCTMTCLFMGATAGTKNKQKQHSDKELTSIGTFEYHESSDFNDSNSSTYQLICLNFYGKTMTLLIDGNGTDQNFHIILLLDPAEVNETQITKLYPIYTVDVNAVTPDFIFRPVEITDSAGTKAYGPPLPAGDLYIGKSDCNGVDNIRVYGAVENKWQ